MKDAKHIAGFIVLGLIVAYATSGPLRNPVPMPTIGTPLRSAPVYAEGTISVSPELKTQAEQMGAIFIFARPVSAEGGAPIAVKKYDFPTFPLDFALTQDDNMVMKEFFSGELRITARLDKDGSAGPKGPADREASIEVLEGQTRKVNILISDPS